MRWKGGRNADQHWLELTLTTADRGREQGPYAEAGEAPQAQCARAKTCRRAAALEVKEGGSTLTKPEQQAAT